ncbi:N-ethylammeline chlorohydrolase [Clostridiales bacterium PH28_bin88]|nr:N-ethylammeline chlorohydrolase [Clostridiales bacterium PH28_bin88]
MVKGLAEPGDLYYEGEIAVEGHTIAAVGPVGTVPPGWRADRVIQARGMVAMPGFVNAHTHAAMTLLRSYADDLPLMQWLEQKIWPLEAKLEPEDVYWGTMLCILEMIQSGTTSFADMYFYMDQVARAVADSGIRGCLSRGLIGLQENASQALAENRELVRNWHGQADGRVTVMLGPHAPYTCPPAFLEQVMAAADDLRVGLHIHVAETGVEKDDIERQYGKSPVQHLDAVGVFRYPVLAAHCVHLNAEDITVLKERQVGVAHNPESNMKLASGIAPVPQMLEAGIPVALGTDGAASNNNLDMMEEMRAAALLHKVSTGNPTVIPSYQAMEMATKNGARALGLRDVGTLQAGKKADIILLDFERPHLYPHHDILAHLVYAAQAADVQTVIVNGRVLMENREVKTIDTERVLYEVSHRAKRLTGK